MGRVYIHDMQHGEVGIVYNCIEPKYNGRIFKRYGNIIVDINGEDLWDIVGSIPDCEVLIIDNNRIKSIKRRINRK